MKNDYFGKKRCYYSISAVETVDPSSTKSETRDIEPNYVEVIQNRIYFYSEIDSDKILRLNKEIRTLNNQLLIDAKIQDREPANIYLHIFSYGGFIDAAFAGVDAIKNSVIPIITVVDGVCASAGTMISLAGSKKLINKNGRMLIHQLSGGLWGNYEQIVDAVKNTENLMKQMKNFYKENTKLSETKLNQIMQRDLYWNADECVRMGLADEII